MTFDPFIAPTNVKNDMIYMNIQEMKITSKGVSSRYQESSEKGSTTGDSTNTARALLLTIVVLDASLEGF